MYSFSPRSQKQSQGLLVREQNPKTKPFGAGVYNDIPASLVPPSGLSFSKGYIPFEKRLEACGGVTAWSATTLPGLTGRTGYSLSKTGTTVIKTVGTAFSEDDIGNFIVYDDGKCDRINGYTSATTVTVETNGTRPASTAAYIRGPVNGTFIHRGQSKILLHIDTRLFVADVYVTSYTEATCISYRKLANTISAFEEEGDYAVLQCSTGIFKIDLSETPYLFWKINSPIPTNLPSNVIKSIENVDGYKYTYAMSRISGDSNIRNRQTKGAIIEHETGTCNPNSSSEDYGTRWQKRPIGDQSSTYGVLTGGTMPAGYDTPAEWAAVSNGQFRISINGTSHNILIDFTGISSMPEVASKIQFTLRAIDSSITCEFVNDHIVFTNPAEGGSISYTSAGDSGTDIGSSALGCQSGTATATNPLYTLSAWNLDDSPRYQADSVKGLTVPVDPVDTTIPEFYHTHYSIYRSLNIGERGINPITGEGNNEEQFVWCADIPVAKAFVASRTGIIVTATEGVFTIEDLGCYLKFEDGTEVKLTHFESSTEVWTEDDSGSIGAQSAAIGGHTASGKGIRVLTASQSATAVTWISGEKFANADIGKMIFWAHGVRSHITAVAVGGESCTVAESATITSQAACMDPKMRSFNDTISDDILRARIVDYSLQHRYWKQFPEGDMLRIVPGFMFVAERGTKDVFYQELPRSKEYLMGYYNPRQRARLKDGIQIMSEFPNVIALYCNHSTTVISTNSFITYYVNDTLTISLISGQNVADEQIGIRDFGSLCKLPNGIDWMITSEPAVKLFDGQAFSDNLADERMMNVIQSLHAATGAFYEPFNGVNLYGLDE